MARQSRRRPTDGELEILAVLWARGGCSVRDVHQSLLQCREVHYNSVLKTLQIMREKGSVTRDESAYPQIYRAVAGRAKTERHLIKDLVDRVFGGSIADLIMRAASTKKASPEEIRQIRQRLEKLEEDP